MNRLIKRKYSIVLSTIELMNSKGILSFTTKDVAKKEGVTEAAIFKQYKNKKELVLAVIEHYEMYDKDIIHTIELNDLGALEAIKFYFNTYAIYYQNYHDITVITSSLDMLRIDDDYRNVVDELERRKNEFLKSTIRKGIINGEINHVLNPSTVANMVSGLFLNTVLQWRRENYKFSLKSVFTDSLEEMLELIKERR